MENFDDFKKNSGFFYDGCMKNDDDEDEDMKKRTSLKKNWI